MVIYPKNLADAVKTTVVYNSDDAEDVDFVVCRRLTTLALEPGNSVARCSKCDEAIQHRPFVPTSPKKICDECFQRLVKKNKAKFEAFITPKTAHVLAAEAIKKS